MSRTSRGIRVGLDLGSSGPAVRTVYEAFAAAPTAHYLGAGEQRDHVDLRGRGAVEGVEPLRHLEGPSPFYLSSEGYGVRFLTTAVGRMAFGRVDESNGCELGTTPCEIAPRLPVVQACFKTDALSYEIYPGRPASGSCARTPRAPVGPHFPNRTQFAVTKWRDRIGSAAELVEDVDTFRAAGIPLGWVIVDNPWETRPLRRIARVRPGPVPRSEGNDRPPPRVSGSA